jgi:hypothetical protein
MLQAVVIPKPQQPDNTTERREFQKTLKKAIVSLQQLQQATKSTTGETPYNTHGKGPKTNRPERNLSSSSYGTNKQNKAITAGKLDDSAFHDKGDLENDTQQKSQRYLLSPYKIERVKSPKEETKKKVASSLSPSGQDRVENIVVLPSQKKNDHIMFSLQHLKEPSGTPTANLR